MTPGEVQRVLGTLAIRVNHERPNTLEVPETFETSGDFTVEITNGGKPIHVHLNYDDDLAPSLSMEVGNHFIPRKGVFELPVEVDVSERPFHGKLRVSTGYGAETQFVEIRVVEPSQDQKVTVDERLAKPPVRDEPRPISDQLLDEIGALIVLGLALLALIGGAAIVALITTPLVGLILLVVMLLIAGSTYVLVGDT